MLVNYKPSLNIVEALRKYHLDVHTHLGIKTLHRDEASAEWSIAEQSYLVISSLKGFPIYESTRTPKRQAVPA